MVRRYFPAIIESILVEIAGSSPATFAPTLEYFLNLRFVFFGGSVGVFFGPLSFHSCSTSYYLLLVFR